MVVVILLSIVVYHSRHTKNNFGNMVCKGDRCQLEHVSGVRSEIRT